MPKLGSDIQQVISGYTEQLQKAIAEADWENLNDLLQQRQDDLERFFASQAAKEKKSDLVAMIEEIQTEDALCLRVLQAQKKELEKQCNSLKQGRKSVKAYQNIA